MDEISLYHKLNVLQAKVLKFHEEISPVKKQENEKALLLYDEESKFLSICNYIAIGFLKILFCLLGPTLFPAIIYCIEGSSQLFWQVTILSCVITLFLALMVATVLCMNLKMVQTKMKEMLESLKNLFSSTGPLQFLRNMITSEFLRENIHRVLYPAALVIISGLVSYVSYERKIWIVFYASLVSIGFICGILMATICDILKSPELLPLHSPYKIRMELATPKHEANRELDFTLRETSRVIPSKSRMLTRNTLLVGQIPELTETPVTTALPNYSASINREKAEDTVTYNLPFNFSKFLRGFQLN